MTRPIRILQLCHDYKGPFGSIPAQYAMSFADCEMHTVFLRGAPREELTTAIAGKVSFLQLKRGELRGLKFDVANKVQTLIGDAKPDLVIAHRYKPFVIANIMNRRLEFTHVIGVMHEYGFLARWSRSLFSRFWRRNVSLIGVSEPVCDAIAASHPRLRERLHFVPNAIQPEILEDSVTARHKLGIPNGVYCYGAVGRLVWKKQHRLLLQGFAQLLKDDRVIPDAVLAIVGDGELRETLQLQADQLGISRRVVFCGEHQNVKRLLKAFDSFVMTSGVEEAFGLVLLEAMAAGVPMVCSDAAGPASVTGDAALLFRTGDVGDLADKMRSIAELTEAQKSDLIKAGFDRLATEYSMASVTHRLRNLPAIKALGLPAEPGATTNTKSSVSGISTYGASNT